MNIKPEYLIKLKQNSNLQMKIALAVKGHFRSMFNWIRIEQLAQKSSPLCSEPARKVMADEWNISLTEMIDFSRTPSLDPKKEKEAA